MTRIYASHKGDYYCIGRDFLSVLIGEQLSSEPNAPIEYLAVMNKGNTKLFELKLLIFAQNDIEALLMLQETAKRNRCKVTVFNRRTPYDLVQFDLFCKSFIGLEAPTQVLLNRNNRNFNQLAALGLVSSEIYEEALKIAQEYGLAREVHYV